ncbi:MAG: hypothetical protein NC181_02855 [Clostridium sp.]|nr:hypothetical protein [Clostridium sp.]MCM1444176.1 hypothetical protein [Candidatus Amulumruptor caecigallinarius]
MKIKSKISESYVIEVDGEITLNLVTHLAFLNKDEVTISSLYGDFVDITLTKIDMLKISKFIREDYPNRSILKLDNISFEINPNWVIITNGDKKIEIRPEMFEKITKHIEEREEKIMESSNLTQEVYNKIINATASQNNKPTEEMAKPIETVGQQKKQSLYDTIINTMKQETKGGNGNGK